MALLLQKLHYLFMLYRAPPSVIPFSVDSLPHWYWLRPNLGEFFLTAFSIYKFKNIIIPKGGRVLNYYYCKGKNSIKLMSNLY